MKSFRNTNKVFLALAAVTALLCSPMSFARAENAEKSEQGPALPWAPGPKHLALEHGVQLELPKGYQFLPQPDAGNVMVKLGNLHNENLLGLVVSQAPKDEYLIAITYDEEGFIKDDEKLDGEELLSSMRDGEDDYNEERKKAGFPPIHVEGWKEPPHYDRATHHVIWGLVISDSEGKSLNYNTRVLGRKGYVSVNLVTDPELLATHQPAGAQILAATTFTKGSRYEDFDAKSDKVAEYGLTGLILGGAGFGVAKLVKIGLLAKFGKVLLGLLIAGKKAILVAVIGVVAALKKFFGRKDERAA